MKLISTIFQRSFIFLIIALLPISTAKPLTYGSTIRLKNANQYLTNQTTALSSISYQYKTIPSDYKQVISSSSVGANNVSNWVIQSASGKPNGTNVVSGDLIYLQPFSSKYNSIGIIAGYNSLKGTGVLVGILPAPQPWTIGINPTSQLQVTLTSNSKRLLNGTYIQSGYKKYEISAGDPSYNNDVWTVEIVMVG